MIDLCDMFEKIADFHSYDTILLGSFFAFPPFAKRYGRLLTDGQDQVAAAWQTGLMDGSQVGSVIGLTFNGWLCDKIGFKKTYFTALALMTAFIFIPFFAENDGMLLAGQVLSGIPWGKLHPSNTLVSSY